MPSNRPAACVEVGASNIETVLFRGNGDPALRLAGPHQPPGYDLALAVPGIVENGSVTESSNLGWRNVDPVAALDLTGPASVVINDAEAAALGEAELRPSHVGPVVYLGLGTGIGGAVVEGGQILAGNLFGHMTGYSSAVCSCGRTGCLETVAAGWSLPDPIDAATLAKTASSLAASILNEPLSRGGPLVVVGGGIARKYPEIVDLMAPELDGLRVEPSRAPSDAKSAAAWGLFLLLKSRSPSNTSNEGQSTMVTGGL